MTYTIEGQKVFLQNCLAIPILFLIFAPDISSVVFSCTMVLIVCLHLSLLSTGGFFYTLSPVPHPPIPLCNGTPGVPGEFNHPFLQQIGGCLNLENSEGMGLRFQEGRIFPMNQPYQKKTGGENAFF